MVIFYKKWKKYNEIQLTKKQNGLKYSKNYKSSTLPRRINHQYIKTHKSPVHYLPVYQNSSVTSTLFTSKFKRINYQYIKTHK